MSYQERLTELANFTEALSACQKKEIRYPRFVLPGLIGIIQESYFNTKVGKYLHTKICGDLTYVGCMNRILDLNKSICQEYLSCENKAPNDIDAIVETSYKALFCWEHICPDIAHNETIERNDIELSIYDCLECQLLDNLYTINPNLPIKHPYERMIESGGCMSSIKGCGLQMVSIILHCFAIAVIGFILIGIINLFD